MIRICVHLQVSEDIKLTYSITKYRNNMVSVQDKLHHNNNPNRLQSYHIIPLVMILA
jgi:hypothetical protein